MRRFVVFLIAALVYRPCCSGPIPEEESVVSVYTTQPTTAGTSGLDVYQQIANNIAERITSPIYRFLGIKNNATDEHTTKKPWEKIELLDELPEDATKTIQPVDNDISIFRDVEELSVEALKKVDKKPEKLTLYSSYLPVSDTSKVNEKQVSNNTLDELDDIDDPFEFDEEPTKGREGPFVFILEWFGSLLQIAWGAFEAIFRPSNSK